MEASLQSANIIISQAVTSADRVLNEAETLLQNVNTLTDKVNYIIDAPKNITNIITKGQILGKDLKYCQIFNAVNKLFLDEK